MKQTCLSEQITGEQGRALVVQGGLPRSLKMRRQAHLRGCPCWASSGNISKRTKKGFTYRDISPKHFSYAAGFFRGCAVTVVTCEQSVGCQCLFFFSPSGRSDLHAPSVATSKASTLST